MKTGGIKGTASADRYANKGARLGRGYGDAEERTTEGPGGLMNTIQPTKRFRARLGRNALERSEDV